MNVLRCRSCSTPLAALAMIVLLGGARAAEPTGPVNLNFEEGDRGQMPKGWLLPPVCAQAGYSATLTDDRPKSGKQCVLITKDRAGEQQGFGNLLQSFDAEPFRGKRIRLKAAV